MKNKINKIISKKLYESSQLIGIHIDQWDKIQEGMSIRSWAKLINISPTYLNLVLNSKRLISSEALKRVCKALDLDPISIKKLEEARKRDWLADKKIQLPEKLNEEQSSNSSKSPELVLDGTILLKSWIHMALLDFTTCENFTSDLNRLAYYFNSKPDKIRKVLEELLQAGFLKKDTNQKLTKVHENLRVSVPRSSKSIRAFHLAMMKKAMDTISTQPATADVVSKRRITSYTVAVNENQLPEAFEKINDSILVAIDHLKKGPCTSVYQIQYQVLPLLQMALDNKSLPLEK